MMEDSYQHKNSATQTMQNQNGDQENSQPFCSASKNLKLTGIDALLKSSITGKNPLTRSMSKILNEKGMTGASMFATSFTGQLNDLGKDT